jgi:putative Holliday junction resolvase
MRWLCLDLGEKRTGVALSSPEETFAVPLFVLEHGIEGPSPEGIARLLDEHSAEGLVIGLPLSLGGKPSQQTWFALGVARRIATYLGTSLSLPDSICGQVEIHAPDEAEAGPRGAQEDVAIVLWDERLSTWDAGRLAPGESPHRRGQRRKPRRLDAHAAAVILQSYLDSLPRGQRRDSDPNPRAAAG